MKNVPATAPTPTLRKHCTIKKGLQWYRTHCVTSVLIQKFYGGKTTKLFAEPGHDNRREPPVIKTIIVGAGKVGQHIATNPDLYGLQGLISGFVDDDTRIHGCTIFGCPVLGPVDWLQENQGYDVVIALASPSGYKKTIVERLTRCSSLKFPTLIAKNAWVSNNCTIGDGSIIYPGSCLNHSAQLGRFVVINMNCAVGHDSKLGNYACLAPGVCLAGKTIVAEGVEMGIGSATVQGVTIGHGSVIGGLAMVTRNIAAGVVAFGNPAKEVRKVDGSK